jgi:hypothetical protein
MSKIPPIIIFKMMRTKMKISYHASIRKISVLEHILLAMIKSYQVLRVNEELVKNPGSFWEEADVDER